MVVESFRRLASSDEGVEAAGVEVAAAGAAVAGVTGVAGVAGAAAGVAAGAAVGVDVAGVACVPLGLALDGDTLADWNGK